MKKIPKFLQNITERPILRFELLHELSTVKSQTFNTNTHISVFY
jgi:hypothetical protein